MLQSIQRLFKLWKNQQKSYQSPLQIILDQWDKSHPPSPSQKKEILKHQDIQNKRDHKESKKRKKKTWLDQDDIH
ncbi:MAG: CBU_0585 family protein [Pseudomonadota bacterium]|nr:CBU_0585 family protein [Pseudomonadota bacterium]|tara:strand:+ start:188 stop:412 length:225 start_codon:yes stop_codon:yes gene_type:complete